MDLGADFNRLLLALRRAGLPTAHARLRRYIAVSGMLYVPYETPQQQPAGHIMSEGHSVIAEATAPWPTPAAVIAQARADAVAYADKIAAQPAGR